MLFMIIRAVPGVRSYLSLHGIVCIIQLDAKGIFGVKLPGFCNEDLGEIGINLPVPVLIGLCQGVAENLSPDDQMIKSGPCCPQTGFDVSQALPAGKLCEGHAEVLVPARETDYFVLAIELIDTFPEFVCGNKVHQLGKDCFSCIDEPSPCLLMRQPGTFGENISN